VTIAALIALSLALATLVYLDARRLDWSGRRYGAPDWAILTFVVWPVGVVLYAVRRPRGAR
jgi:hypothetical protein